MFREKSIAFPRVFVLCAVASASGIGAFSFSRPASAQSYSGYSLSKEQAYYLGTELVRIDVGPLQGASDGVIDSYKKGLTYTKTQRKRQLAELKVKRPSPTISIPNLLPIGPSKLTIREGSNEKIWEVEDDIRWADELTQHATRTQKAKSGGLSVKNPAVPNPTDGDDGSDAAEADSKNMAQSDEAKLARLEEERSSLILAERMEGSTDLYRNPNSPGKLIQSADAPRAIIKDVESGDFLVIPDNAS